MLLNNLNSQSYIYDISNIDGCVKAEREAQALDNEIMSLRVELSNQRLDFLNKHHKYITSIDKVKSAKLNKILFPGKVFAEFVKQIDEIILYAESEIIDLASQRENATPEMLNQINAEIKKLLSFIEVKNSLVNRRLVEECRDNKIDIVAELQNRRANKKEWREKLNKIKNNQRVEKEPAKTPSQPQPQSVPKEEGPSVTFNIPNATVKPNQSLVFNPRHKTQLVNKEKSFIGTANEVTISLIRNGIKIKYSQQLKEKLSQLNAKLSLVNKNNYRSRTSANIDDTQEEQVIAFKDNRDLVSNDEYKNYKVEIRIPNGENKKGSDVLFEYDFENQQQAKSR